MLAIYLIGSAECTAMKFCPLHDRVVVNRIDAEEKTAGGIIIPDTANERSRHYCHCWGVLHA